MSAIRGRIERALIPLDTPPTGPAWNHAAMVDWLGDAALAPAAVLVAIRDGDAQQVVLTRRHDALTAHPGQVAFPGGSMEPDDVDLVDTALRETEEEVGLPRATVTPLGFLDPLETTSHFLVTPVVARVAADAPPLVPNAAEVADVFEVPLAFFLDPAEHRKSIVTAGGRRRAMVEFHFDGYRIWGATAAMLLNLLERMGEHVDAGTLDQRGRAGRG